ncbi:MAG: AraC family transcriptional regulator [Thalassotalea sp.]
MQPERFETGSGGFVWENITPDELFSRVQFHVYMAFDMHIDKTWAGNEFINHYNRIYYVKSGTAELTFKDQTIEMKPGHLYIIPPYQLVSHKSHGDLHFYWTHFQASLDPGVDLFMFYGKATEIDCRALPNIETDFLSLIEHTKQKTASAIFERNRLILSLLHPFMVNFDQSKDSISSFRHQSLLPALTMINQHISNPPDIKSLAKAAGMSPEHFSRKFKSAFSISPKRYILQKRIALAKQRLLLDDESIDRIAEKCGFCDIFHFSRTFKQETGISPSLFRKEYDLTQLLSQT